MGNNAVKMFRKHTVLQSPWQGNASENVNITDQDDAKYTARMADRFVFRYEKDKCSGNARYMAGKNESPARAFRRDRMKKWTRTQFEIITQ